MAYTYRITHIPTGRHYYGVRFKPNCQPTDLWIKYFTSSKTVHNLIEQDGLEAFNVEVRKVFEDADEARNWEQRVLKRLKVTKNPLWLNKSAGKCPSGKGYKWTPAQLLARQGKYPPITDEHKEKIRQRHTGKIQTKETKSKQSKAIRARMEADPKYAEQKKQEARDRFLNPVAKERARITRTGMKRTPEQKERMRQARLAYVARQKEETRQC